LMALDGAFAELNRQGRFSGAGSAPLEPVVEDAEPTEERGD
jgi:hypothetical protein